MRYLVFGAGAVGGVVGGRLSESGHDVVLVARGKHLEAIRSNGLTVASRSGSVTLQVPIVSHPAEAELVAGDVVIIATKSQDTDGVLDALVTTGCDQLNVVCAQNGVNNERAALRRFADVYGICVMAPTAHSEPGVVEAHCEPVTGILDIGRYPSGTDQTCEAIAGDLSESTFVSVPRPDIMRWKYRKLTTNLHNAVEALLGPDGWPEALTSRVRSEADDVLAAAGVDVASEEEDRNRRGNLLRFGRASVGRRGGSSWQSLSRGLGTIETDYLNGEIVLLGRLHGIPTPANALLQRLAAQAARNKSAPGSMSAEDLLAMLG